MKSNYKLYLALIIIFFACGNPATIYFSGLSWELVLNTTLLLIGQNVAFTFVYQSRQGKYQLPFYLPAI